MCKADNCYTFIHLNNGEQLVVCKSLSKFLKYLTPEVFIRVNQSYVVNQNHILLINRKQKTIKLSSDDIIPFTINLRDLIGLISQKNILIFLSFINIF